MMCRVEKEKFFRLRDSFSAVIEIIFRADCDHFGFWLASLSLFLIFFS